MACIHMIHLFRIVERASFVVGVTGFVNATELHVSHGTWAYNVNCSHATELRCRLSTIQETTSPRLRPWPALHRFIGHALDLDPL